jgi:hypothetical protein
VFNFKQFFFFLSFQGSFHVASDVVFVLIRWSVDQGCSIGANVGDATGATRASACGEGERVLQKCYKSDTRVIQGRRGIWVRASWREDLDSTSEESEDSEGRRQRRTHTQKK